MLRTNDAGTAGSTAAISRRTALAAASGAPSVWTTQYMLFASQMVVASGTCEIGTYTSIVASFSRPKCLTSPTTPTISTSAAPSRHRPGACARRPGCRLPVLPRERLVDDRDGRRVGAIGGVKRAAASQRNAERAEVVGADHPVVRFRRILRDHAVDEERRSSRDSRSSARRWRRPPRERRGARRCAAAPARRSSRSRRAVL